MPAGRLFVRAMLRRFDAHVFGLDNVPSQGPVIMASNHMGYLDGPLLFGVSPRPVHALVKEQIFVGRLGYTLERLGQIRVDRDHYDPRAVKRCLRVLADGGVLAIYPEGARGRGDVAVARGGVAYLALVTGAVVVPVASLGTRDDGAGTSSMPRRGARLDVVFGAPMRFEPVPWPRTTEKVAAVLAEIHAAMAANVVAACELTGQRLPALPLDLTAGSAP
jgi:1-acyl-sn-glycerol-3-phosphate acyltransferase